MCKNRNSANEYYWNLERCISCIAETPTLKNLLDTRK